MDDSYLPLMTLGMNVWVMSVVRTAIVDLIVETQAQRLEDVVLDEKVVCDEHKINVKKNSTLPVGSIALEVPGHRSRGC